jgi:2-polyprenyl-3-methyl-5-hydroxy-6-metoxy-1,4-benzoquinol methylase
MSAADLWALGDYHRVAVTLWPAARELVRAAGIAAGQRVLDVAAGTGNVALEAAALGARVTASDVTPELVESGRSAARRNGRRWIALADELLPRVNGGVLFAPDYALVIARRRTG